MNIVSTNLFTLQFPQLPSSPPAKNGGDPCYLIGLQTDEAKASFGEASVPSEQHLADALELLAPVLEEADPLDRSVLGERMITALVEAKVPREEYIGVVSAVDLALWDLAGQACGLPVFRLLGGAHFSPIDTYLLPPEHLTAGELLRWVQQLPDHAAGGIGLAINPTDNKQLELVHQLRQQIGSQRRLVIRATESCADLETAQQAGQSLEKAEVFWAEDLLPTGHWEEYAQLRQRLDLPLAAGGSLRDISQFYQLSQSEAVDIVVVDLRLCGGITAAVKIADLARLGGMRVTFREGRCPLTTLAAAHLSAAVPLSLPVALPASFTAAPSDFFTFAGQFEDGFLQLSDQPGWGGELKSDFVRPYKVNEEQ